tara:strand:- start:12670 stop:13476 length:807 start_codon:yes stop_codon:yes gene_type:complete
MKLNIINKQNKETGTIDLPSQFNEKVRTDLIKRAVLVIQSHNYQPYGADPRAGKKSSAKLSRRRRKYRGSYGHGISRVPRKIVSRRGTRFNWIGAFAPGTVGGRRAHPPKADKIISKKINKKENRKAIRSALAAVIDKITVKKRGHKVPENYPFIIDNEFEKLNKTKDVKTALIAIGLKDELKRSSVKKIRAGRGKMRGRKYRRKKGPLVVVSDNCELIKSAKNIPGIDIVKIKNVNAELLAPGCDVGRLTLFTQKAIEKLGKDKLFM